MARDNSYVSDLTSTQTKRRRGGRIRPHSLETNDHW